MLIITFSIFSCKKDDVVSTDPAIIRTYKNERTIPLDSIQAMNQITNQKIQELYDLGLLYVYNTSDNELDSILTNQINNYFVEKDTFQVNAILNDIKDSKTHFIKIADVVKQEKDSTESDSIGISRFLIKYYNKEKKFMNQKEKFVQYILKKNPETFKREFKFYFLKFAKNDSILKGEIK